MYYIYKIENIINHKVYIGLTNNIVRRRSRHFTDLKCNRHDNSFLQKEYNIYGKDNFTFNIEYQGEITSDEISKKEQEYIKLYNSYRNGYNQNEGGNFGPSNGSSHLTQSDVFNILAVLNFMSRPGQILSDIFGVSRTTISRIKKGENHCEFKEEYDNLSMADKQEIYHIFCESNNLLYKKANSSKLDSKRKLTEQQVHLVFLNEELNRPMAIAHLIRILNIQSSNTIYCILKGQTYQDYKITYDALNKNQKEQLATLLRNQ